MNKHLQHFLFNLDLDTERKARERGHDDIAESCRARQIGLIRARVMS